MRLHITPKLFQNGSTTKYVEAAEALGHTLLVNRPQPRAADNLDYAVGHPDRMKFCKSGVHETGFFWNAAHIDTRNLWDLSSLTLPGATEEITAFGPPPVGVRDLVRKGAIPSKYAERSGRITEWDGVVLAAQCPTDRSIQYIGNCMNSLKYWDFVREACEKYGPRLLIKLHPMTSYEGDILIHRRLAGQHGATCAYAQFNVLDDCAFVLVYSSGFAVDCWLRGVRVAQYAPGYFYRTGAVTYTNGRIPDEDEVEDCQERADKVLDFLAWRYCFPLRAAPKWLIAIAAAYANSDALFPLPAELSWGAWMQKGLFKERS